MFALWLYQLPSEKAGQYTTSLCNGYVFWFENNVNPFQIWKGMLEYGTAEVEAIITDLLALGISFSLSLSPILKNRRKFT